MCQDLLCLAKLRLPTSQGSDKEMWVSQASWAVFHVHRLSQTVVAIALRWSAVKGRCEHHLSLFVQ
jgi:hypothetical protein